MGAHGRRFDKRVIVQIDASCIAKTYRNCTAGCIGTEKFDTTTLRFLSLFVTVRYPSLSFSY